MEAAKNKKTKLYFPLKSQICFFYESDFYLNLRIEPAPLLWPFLLELSKEDLRLEKEERRKMNAATRVITSLLG